MIDQDFARLVLNTAASASTVLRREEAHREVVTKSASAMALDSLDKLADVARGLLGTPVGQLVPGPWERVLDAAKQIAGLANDGLDGPADDAIVKDLAAQIVA